MTFTAEHKRLFEQWIDTSVASVVFANPEAKRQFITWLIQQNIPHRLNDKRGTIEMLNPHALDSVVVNSDMGEVTARSSQNFLDVCIRWMLQLHPVT